jgi:hypothetical protein
MLLMATTVLWVRSFWITERWSKGRVFEQDNTLRESETVLTFSGVSIALQFIDRNYQPDRTNTHPASRPSFLPRDSSEEELHQDFPVGDYFEHHSYGPTQAKPKFPVGFGYWGFLWEREISDPPAKLEWDGQTTTRYFQTMALKNGHTYTCQYDHTTMAIPWWFLVLLFGASPARALIRRYRARRMPRPGHCEYCGYDLRATPGRCPECGALPSQSETPAAAVPTSLILNDPTRSPLQSPPSNPPFPHTDSAQ